MSNHFITVCEYGQQHGTCRCPSPVKAVRQVKCNMKESHKAIHAASKAAEINHETVVETSLYRIETFAQRHEVSKAAGSELEKIAKDLREALDMEPPDDVA